MKNVMVLYGGVSTEHEVAVITALQVMNALKESGNNVIPVYISKKGEWVKGDDMFLIPDSYKNLGKLLNRGNSTIVTPDRSLGLLSKNWNGFGKLRNRIDVIFPVFHGRNGEDGAIAGLLNLLNLPYVGCQLTASAIGIDKYISKRVAKDLGLNVVEDVLVSKHDWTQNKQEYLNRANKIGYPLFVKPNALGSSIGISKVSNKEDLEDAIEVALAYDSRVLVEKGIISPKEINISVLGNGPYEVSVTEEPVSSAGVLSFEDKYLSNNKKTRGMASAQRYMPARADKKVISEVEDAARKFFAAIGGRGIARIDFMVKDNEKIYFNEINTLPGSIAFYLWEKSGLKFGDLVNKLVELAIEEWQDRQKLITTFESNILAGYSSGTKGSKLST